VSGLSAGEIQANYLAVLARVQQAAERAGRDPASVTLIAVSKTHPASYVLAASAAGAQHFGENRVEEAVGKIPQVAAQSPAPEPVWHMIGHVQSRKGRDVGALFDVVHSLDSLKLARKLAEGVPEGRRLPAYIEVNVSGEASKEGFQLAGWESDAGIVQRFGEELRAIMALERVQPVGLMTMAPIVEDMEAARPIFRSLRLLRDAIQDKTGVHLPGLSMGMTDDFPIAIDEGATVVRVGRAIFGERAPRI
jgi:pyridoxal phosphate enzyme (YggS family)